MCDRLMTLQEAADELCTVVVKEWEGKKSQIFSYPLSDLFPKSLWQKERFYLRWDCLPHRRNITHLIDPREVRDHWIYVAVLPTKVWKLFHELGLFTDQGPEETKVRGV